MPKDPINHVVVLALENHSFDQMLGCLKELYPGLEGVTPNAPNQNTDSDGRVYVQRPTEERQMRFDPHHEVEHVREQLELPGLHELAQHFTICDHWFSSLPGPTWPNRCK
jgi:phospholipase C